MVIGQIRQVRFVFDMCPMRDGPSKSKFPTRWEWVKSPAEENDNWFILWCDKQSTIIFGNLQLFTVVHFCVLSRFKAEIWNREKMSEPVMTETSISGENGGKRRARSRKGTETKFWKVILYIIYSIWYTGLILFLKIETQGALKRKNSVWTVLTVLSLVASF